ncbi:hypothetical protein [Krasilnikovia sp. M28-CT-15]|uniref:hypothetical protein n=1 Tax=Krasilnikovia sp. M28-CT-15 TaxID=3373540 RepID=UPI0038768EED
MSKLFKRLAVSFAGASVIVGLAATPAYAHDLRVEGPWGCGNNPLNQRCGYGQVRDQHEIVDACDVNADGAGFYVKYELRNGSFGTVGDGNGAKAGCGIKRVGSTSKVAKIQVCSDYMGICLPWKDA